MRLVAAPTDLVASGIALGATAAGRGEVFEHLRQGLSALAMNGRFLGRRTDPALPGAATLLRWRRCFCRTRHDRGLFGDRGWPRRSGGDREPRRMHACSDGGAVAADVPDQFAAKMFLGQRLMHPLRQPTCGKLVEGSREGRFGRGFLARRETADAPQGTINRQPLDQPPPSCSAPVRAWRQTHPPAKSIRAADAPLRTMTIHKFFDAYPLENVNYLLQLRRQRANVVAQFGQQIVLNHVPALRDQIASGSIHFAGFMMLVSKPHHARNGSPHLPVSPPAAK